MAVHNDEEVLPYSLNCLSEFDGEIIIVLDNPSSASRGLVERFVQWHSKTVTVEKTNYPVENVVWSSYLFGTQFATGTRIIWTAADLVFPPSIFQQNVPLPCRFQYVDADNHLTFAWFKLLAKFSKHYCVGVFPANYPFHKYRWLSEEKMRQSNHNLIPFHHVNSILILHLRRNKNHLRHWIQGRTRKQQGTNPLKVLLHSLLFLKPYVLLGWLYETFKVNQVKPAEN